MQNVLDAVAGSGLIAGVTNGAKNIADPAHPCNGAVPHMHSHFFRAGGAWGSLDYNGQQVDDGHYQIVDDHTVVIESTGENAVTFHYRLIDANTSMFDPVLPACARQGLLRRRVGSHRCLPRLRVEAIGTVRAGT
jgi:hypothetical protein